MDVKREKEKRYLITSVNFHLNMWSDSGEVDYLHKAIAAIQAQIKAEAEK